KQVLNIANTDVKNPGSNNSDLAQPFLSWEMSKPGYRLDVDLEKAAAHGLSPAKIADQAYYALRGGFATEYYRLPNKRPATVLVRYQEDERRHISDLDGMLITGANGEQIPLLELVTLKNETAPSLIEHDQLRRAISIGGYY